jgi:hypothetical protein
MAHARGIKRGAPRSQKHPSVLGKNAIEDCEMPPELITGMELRQGKESGFSPPNLKDKQR